jgi:hypothetical protein
MHFGFPATVNPWFTFGVQTVTGATTAIVAWIVAQISKRQAETNRQKLRLDLYERRYAVYREARRFRDSVTLWKDSETEVKRADSFAELSEQAGFLFPPNSGVTSHLEEMGKRAHFILNFDFRYRSREGKPEEQASLAEQKAEHDYWLSRSMPELEKRMGPYLNFYSI